MTAIPVAQRCSVFYRRLAIWDGGHKDLPMEKVAARKVGLAHSGASAVAVRRVS